MNMNSRLLKPLPLLCAALALTATGCLFDGEKSGPAAGDKARIHTGAPLDSIRVARTGVLVGRTLFVADRDSLATGIVGVDIYGDTVVSFYPETLVPNDMALSGDSLIVIAESDYANGSLSLLDLRSGQLTPSYRSIDADNALSASGDTVFLMERTLGVVTGFTGGKLEDGKVFLNAQAGKGSNPYQTAVAGGKAFVTRYNLPSLLILDPSKIDGGARDSVDLSAYAASALKDSSGAAPGMDAVVAYGGNLYVTVQRLTGYKAQDTSKVLVIDRATRKVVKEIPLMYRNPIAAKALGKFLYVSCVDGYGTQTGGVERIDMEKGESAGSVVAEDALQADVSDFVPVTDAKGYVIYTNDFATVNIKAVQM
jgi:hypothetical protein